MMPIRQYVPCVSKPCCTCSAKWEEEQNLGSNYAANKLVLDPNQYYGRNSTKAKLKSKEERNAKEEETFSDDDGEGGRKVHADLHAHTTYTYSTCGVLFDQQNAERRQQ